MKTGKLKTPVPRMAEARTLTETERIARRVLGGAHPITKWIERSLRKARAALRALWCPRIAVFEEFCELGGDDLNNFVS